jgi:large subunit ribosomal protein L17
MARKTYHGKVGVKFKAPWTASKQLSMMRNLVTDLVVHGHVDTTVERAKALSKLADNLVTLGKRGDLHARRQAAATLRMVGDLNPVAMRFTDIAPKFADRNGGYTRVLKLGNRLGDNAELARVEFVA